MLCADIYTGDGPAIPASAPALNQFRLLDCDPWRPAEKVSAEFQKQMGCWTGCKGRILKETGLGNMHHPPSPPPDGVGRERVWRLKRKPILLTCNPNKKDENNLLGTVGASGGEWEGGRW